MEDIKWAQENYRTKIIEINKDNYKGYLELYQLKIGIDPLTQEYQKLLPSSLDSLDNIVKSLKKYNKMIEENSFPQHYLELFGYEKILEQKKLLETQFMMLQMLKMKYPYVDCNIGLHELEESLLKVQLLKKENGIFYKLDFHSFEKYLQIKELIEGIISLEKYNYQSVDDYDKTIPHVKIKIKENCYE